MGVLFLVFIYSNELADLCLALEMGGKANEWDTIAESAQQLSKALKDVIRSIEAL